MVNALGDWFFSVIVLLATFAIVAGLRTGFKRFKLDGRLPVLAELAPSLTNIILIIGFRLFVEMAPLNPRVQVWLENAIYVLTILFVIAVLRQAALLGIEWGATRTTNSESLKYGFIPLMRNLVTLFVFFMGSIMVLKHFNYDVISLITALGVGSLAVGLAAKDTLSNMISGFILIIDRNLRPGDRINLTGFVGTVEEIGLRSTRIKMGDGNMLIVPNQDLVNGKILNLSLPTREVTASTSICVPYAVPFARIREISMAALSEIKHAHPQRAQAVNLQSLADGYQQIVISFWLDDPDHSGAAVSDLNEKLLTRFAQAAIPLVESQIKKAPLAPQA